MIWRLLWETDEKLFFLGVLDLNKGSGSQGQNKEQGDDN